MGDLDIDVAKFLDEDDNVESKKEQDAMRGAESTAKTPRHKFLEPSLLFGHAY